MFLKKIHLFAACLAVLPSVSQSATVDLIKGSDWTEFRFDINRDGGAWLETNDTLGILSFVVTLAEAAYLQVTDAYLSGDRFEVFANGSSLGMTSPSNVGADIGDLYTAAAIDDLFSSGLWLLEAGEHTITGFVRDMPEEMGRGAIRVVDVASVPLPGTLALMLGAGVAFGAASRRRRKLTARRAAE